MIGNVSLWTFRIAFILSIIIAFARNEPEMFLVSGILFGCLSLMELFKSRSYYDDDSER